MREKRQVGGGRAAAEATNQQERDTRPLSTRFLSMICSSSAALAGPPKGLQEESAFARTMTRRANASVRTSHAQNISTNCICSLFHISMKIGKLSTPLSFILKLKKHSPVTLIARPQCASTFSESSVQSRLPRKGLRQFA